MPTADFESKIEAALKSSEASTNKEAEVQAVETEDTTPETLVETTEQETETETTAEDTAQPTQDEDPDLLSLSAEEINAIKADPKLAKAYKMMNKAFTQKSMGLAQEKQLVDNLRNPTTRNALIKLMAEQVGLKVVEQIAEQPKTPTQTQIESAVDAHIEELNKIFDPAVSKALKPVFEKIAHDAARAVLEQEVNPLKEVTTTLAQEAYRVQSDAEVKSFKAMYPNEITPEIEAKMAALFDKIPPSDQVSPVEYMDMLYKIVRNDTTKSAAVKEVAQRMTKAAAKQEPRTAVQPNRVTPTIEKKEKRSFDQAFDEEFKNAYGGGR